MSPPPLVACKASGPWFLPKAGGTEQGTGSRSSRGTGTIPHPVLGGLSHAFLSAMCVSPGAAGHLRRAEKAAGGVGDSLTPRGGDPGGLGHHCHRVCDPGPGLPMRMPVGGMPVGGRQLLLRTGLA